MVYTLRERLVAQIALVASPLRMGGRMARVVRSVSNCCWLLADRLARAAIRLDDNPLEVTDQIRYLGLGPYQPDVISP